MEHILLSNFAAKTFWYAMADDIPKKQQLIRFLLTLTWNLPLCQSRCKRGLNWVK